MPSNEVGREQKSRRFKDGVLRQAIVKVAQRCNLDCTYCYVYNRGDSSWANRPPVISERVIRRLSERITEHCRKFRFDSFTIELHGGEPLLVGHRHMRRILEILRATENVTIHFVLQTNGLLLDRAWVELFDEFEVCFGLSIDGPPEIADRRRVMRQDGSGSTEQLLAVISGLRRDVPEFRSVFGGCLCVIDPIANGAEIVDWFVKQGFSEFDLLLPNGNRANLPDEWQGPEPYRRFLLEAFERWYGLGEAAPRIRMFETMMTGLLGGDVYLDSLGGDLQMLCVIESDGSIGLSDVTRLCGGDCSHDRLNIFEHELSLHASDYEVMNLQTLCSTCASCPNLSACGGGYLPHRFDGQGFSNPSLYCDALFALADRMRTVIRRDLPEKLLCKLEE